MCGESASVGARLGKFRFCKAVMVWRVRVTWGVNGEAVVVFHVKVAIGLFCWSKAVVARMAAHVAVTCRPLRYGCLGS